MLAHRPWMRAFVISSLSFRRYLLASKCLQDQLPCVPGKIRPTTPGTLSGMLLCCVSPCPLFPVNAAADWNHSKQPTMYHSSRRITARCFAYRLHLALSVQQPLPLGVSRVSSMLFSKLSECLLQGSSIRKCFRAGCMCKYLLISIGT